jgi:CRP/FNR family cyclic AMP-dependent transcriptional regulator
MTAARLPEHRKIPILGDQLLRLIREALSLGSHVCDNRCVSIPPQTWSRLLAVGVPKAHPAGATLLRQGEPATCVLALTKGRVKIIRIAPDGNVLVLAVRGPGEILGEIALGGNGHSATVVTVDPCQTWVIPADRFRRLTGELGLESSLLQLAMRRIRESEDWRAELAALPAGPRIARALLRLAIAGNGMGGRPDVRLGQAELGRATGLARSTVAVELARLRALGVVATTRRRIVIFDPQRLRQIAANV